MIRTVLALSVLSAAPVQADVSRAVTDHILPGFAQFATHAEALSATAAADCTPAAVQPAYQAAFDAWLGVANLHIGPSETGALSIAYWPDDRAFTPRALTALIADPASRDPATFAEVSIAARGLFALDMLLYDPAFAGYAAGDATCTLVQVVSADLAAQATALDAAWRDAFAAVLTSAGAPGNATYMTGDEALRALYTQLLTGLTFDADMRLARPLGTFDQPRPRMAEAWRSGRPLRNVVLSVKAAQGLAHALTDTDLPLTDAAVARVEVAASRIDDPAFQTVTDPQARLLVDVLHQRVAAVEVAIDTEIGGALGIAAGFNALDGD
ncbi:hypothetical protein SAMN04488003_10680 [Loktanella fryxellensis]|uniref:Imelysin-like domain-containing protein n=1 Tax=Loktanella fryxellensis TaxID=245187 RepID=A0A1H8C6K2_9RHOB|nr:imelysin family protein [Loktanella fryxellensis]SEM90660.1 hypothetical protein SAMN04488003_10680 [Loktanella fryxellensis]